MSMFRVSLLGAAAALIVASAAPAAAHDWSYGARDRTVVNCVRSVCNFGAGHYRHHRRHFHHRHWAPVRVVTPTPYYLVDQGPVYNVPAIPYREPSVVYDIASVSYPYYHRRTYGQRIFYGGVRYGHRWQHGYRHFHHAHHRMRHHRHRAWRQATAYGKPYYARHGARHRHGAWR